ncbi:MAG TPA: CPBP family intramembrane metalloprotease [Actinobacteria bacterium]|nr:CPBP family intramembrane metalloprotease [Actinomycetota bacterium]
MKDKYARLYVALSYAITWVCWGLAFYLSRQNGFALPMVDSLNEFFDSGIVSSKHLFTSIIFTLGVLGPFAAAVVTATLENGSKGRKEIFSAMTNFNFKKSWLAFVLLYPVLVYLIASLFSGLASFGGFLSPLYPIAFFLPVLGYQFLTSGMEEPGWRGYLLPKLLQTYEAERASWILGLIWSIWHWPLIIFMSLDFGIALAIPTLPGNAMALIGVTIIYVWMYRNTKSIFLAMLFHAMLNTAPLFIIGKTDNPLAFFIPIVLSWVLAIWLIKRYGKGLLMKAAPT